MPGPPHGINLTSLRHAALAGVNFTLSKELLKQVGLDKPLGLDLLVNKLVVQNLNAGQDTFADLPERRAKTRAEICTSCTQVMLAYGRGLAQPTELLILKDMNGPQTRGQTEPRPTCLSLGWFQRFWARAPLHPALCAKLPKAFDLQDKDSIKDFIFDGLSTVIIGGKPDPSGNAYVSPLEVEHHLRLARQGRVNYSPRIHVGHVVDFFLQGHNSNVYHFPALDAMETSLEIKKMSYVFGQAFPVSKDELKQRADRLVQDPIFQEADLIVINHDYFLRLGQDHGLPIALYFQYLEARKMRLWLSVVAICEAIQALPKYGKKRVQVVILRNSLSLVATANVKESGRATAFNEAKQYITQFQNDVSIDFFSQMTHATLPDYKHRTMRACMEFFGMNGHRNIEKLLVGDWLAELIVRSTYTTVGITKEDFKGEVHDRFLAEMLRTPLFGRSDVQMDVLKRRNFFAKCDQQGLSGTSEHGENSEDTLDHENLDLSHKIGATLPIPPAAAAGSSSLNSTIALVLDSGRRDGITEACCLELARLGARVLLTSTTNTDDSNNGAPKVFDIIEGLPYRSETYSGNSSDDEVVLVGSLVRKALEDYGVENFDIIVNNVGWNYSLQGTESRVERLRLMRRDSTRNLLALNYIVEYCAEHKHIAKGCRIINIAGMAVNPSVHELLHWESTFHFMEQWTDWFENDPTLGAHDANPVAFATLIPGCVMENPKKPQGNMRDEWWAVLDAMLENWCDKENVEETARIVGLLCQPECAQASLGIIQDGGIASTVNWKEAW